MRALVTGSGGFCGKHLCSFLKSQGLDVFALSSTRAGEGVLPIKDVHDEDGMTRALGQAQPDFIFHLAGLSTSRDPWEIYRVNVGFASCLFRAIDRSGAKQVPILAAGTCAEYGDVDPASLPVDEEHPCRPITDYGISKFAQTRLAVAAFKRGHRVVVTRSSNILGPGIPETLFLGSVVRQLARIAQGKQAAVLEVGNLETSRDFVDVRDAICCYWKLINQPAASGEIVNVSSGKAIQIRALLQKSIELSGKNVGVVSRAPRMKTHDMASFCASNRKLCSLIGDAPVFNLDETLGRVLEFELGRS
jgi:GDP-4-dehydro-6-deoxy-D-mannose reductase